MYIYIFKFIYFNWRIIAIVWWLLPNINMNRPWAYVSPLLPDPLPTPSLHVVTEHDFGFPASYIKLLLPFLHMTIYMIQCYWETCILIEWSELDYEWAARIKELTLELQVMLSMDSPYISLFVWWMLWKSPGLEIQSSSFHFSMKQGCMI